MEDLEGKPPFNHSTLGGKKGEMVRPASTSISSDAGHIISTTAETAGTAAARDPLMLKSNVFSA
jgi:hypothetical protein